MARKPDPNGNLSRFGRWLFEQPPGTAERLAAAAGCGRSTVYGLARAERRATARLALRLYDATGGAIRLGWVPMDPRERNVAYRALRGPQEAA